MSDASACESGCCRGGHNGGDRRGVFADRRRDRAPGASQRARSRPQLRLRRRPLWATARQHHPGSPRCGQRGAAYSGAVCQYVLSPIGDGRRHLFLVRDRQPGPRTGAGSRARRPDRRHRRRASPGVSGAPRHHGIGVLGDRWPAGVLSWWVRCATKPAVTRVRTPKNCCRARCRRSCDHDRPDVLPAVLRCPDGGYRGAGRLRRLGWTRHASDPATACGCRFPQRRLQRGHRRRREQGGRFGDVHQSRGQRCRLLLAGEHDVGHVRCGHGHLDVVVPRQRHGHRAHLGTAGRPHTELSLDGNKGFKAADANACSIYVAKGGDVITWSIQTMNPAMLPDLCSITEQLAQLSQDRVN